LSILGVGEFEELASGGEDDEGEVGVAEHGELVGLLEEAIAALGEGDLAARGVLDAADLDPATGRGRSRLAVVALMVRVRVRVRIRGRIRVRARARVRIKSRIRVRVRVRVMVAS
jgi:hypothetical protein